MTDFSGSELTPKMLNDFQDEYDISGYKRWRTFAQQSIHVTQQGTATVTQAPPFGGGGAPSTGYPGHATIKDARPFPINGADFPVGVAAASRVVQFRWRWTMRPGVVTAQYMTGIGLYQITAVSATPGVPTYSLANSVTFGTLVTNVEQSGVSQPFTKPADGIYMIGIIQPSTAGANLGWVEYALQYRVN